MVQIEKLETAPTKVDQKLAGFLGVYYKQDRPLSPYIFYSCLVLILSMFCLFVCKNCFCFSRKDKLSQLIDIQFVSNADYQDNKNLLPSTSPKDSLGKRTSPVIESKGQLFADPVFVVRAAAVPNNNKDDTDSKEVNHSYNKESFKNTDLLNRYLPMEAPVIIVPKQMAAKRSIEKKVERTEDIMQMDEVKPPELVEVKENEGDNSSNFWQNGGSSSKGSGVSSSLSDYLNDLHRKLKHAWSPPSGTIRHIKVIFRLGRSGNVISMQLVESCGNSEADNSALTAIKGSAPFGKLPADYAHQFLDLAYTFNYTTDELSEIHREEQN